MSMGTFLLCLRYAWIAEEEVLKQGFDVLVASPLELFVAIVQLWVVSGVRVVCLAYLVLI